MSNPIITYQIIERFGKPNGALSANIKFPNGVQNPRYAIMPYELMRKDYPQGMPIHMYVPDAYWNYLNTALNGYEITVDWQHFNGYIVAGYGSNTYSFDFVTEREVTGVNKWPKPTIEKSVTDPTKFTIKSDLASISGFPHGLWRHSPRYRINSVSNYQQVSSISVDTNEFTYNLLPGKNTIECFMLYSHGENVRLGNSITEIETMVIYTSPEKPVVTPSTTEPVESLTLTVNYKRNDLKQYKIGDGAWQSYSAPINVTQNQSYQFRGGFVETGEWSEIETYEVTNIAVAETPPVITIESYETGPTIGPITVRATVDKGELNQSEHTFTDNGSFTFVATDSTTGLSSSVEVVIANIDKEAPAVPVVTSNITTPTNQNVTVNVSFSEKSSLKKVRKNGGTWTNYTGSVVFSENGTLDAKGISAAGVESEIANHSVTNIDKNAPLAPTVEASETASTNQDITLTAYYSNDSVTKEYSLGGGPWIDYTGPIVFEGNGVANFRGKDEAGNWSNVTTYNVANIDKTPPVNPSISYTPINVTIENVIVTIVYPVDADKKQYRVNTGHLKNYTGPFEVEENCTIKAIAKDLAGNSSEEISVEITNIDKDAEKIVKILGSEGLTNSDKLSILEMLINNAKYNGELLVDILDWFELEQSIKIINNRLYIHSSLKNRFNTEEPVTIEFTLFDPRYLVRGMPKNCGTMIVTIL